MKGQVPYLIILVAVVSLIFGIFFLKSASDALTSVVYGACTGKTQQQIEYMKSEVASLGVGEAKNVFLTLGDCVDSVVFIEQAKLQEMFTPSAYEAIFNCPSNSKWIIAAAPHSEGKAGLFNAVKEFIIDKSIEGAKNWARQSLNIKEKPMCENLFISDYSLESQLNLKGPTEPGKTVSFCLQFTRKEVGLFGAAQLSAQTKEECVK